MKKHPMKCDRPRRAANAPRPLRRAAVAHLAGAALLCAGATGVMADGIAPGEWQLTETIIMNGSKTPPQVRSRCLSVEQASDTAKTW